MIRRENHWPIGQTQLPSANPEIYLGSPHAVVVSRKVRADLRRSLLRGIDSMIASAADPQIARASQCVRDPDHKLWSGYGPISALVRLLDPPSQDRAPPPNSLPICTRSGNVPKPVSHVAREKAAVAAVVERYDR